MANFQSHLSNKNQLQILSNRFSLAAALNALNKRTECSLPGFIYRILLMIGNEGDNLDVHTKANMH